MDHDDVLDVGVRFGLLSYGVVHLLMAWLALQLALGDREGTVSGSGALRQLAANDVGRVSLFVIAGGFAVLVVWQVIEAAVGHRDEDGARRAFRRVASLGRAVVYGALGWISLRLALGSGGQSQGTDSLTSRLMSVPFGVFLVGVVGVVLFCIGGGLVFRGWTERFLDDLEARGTTGNEGRAYRWLGKIGYISKGIAFALVGGLFVYAAWTHDPDKSGGLDQALQKLLEQPFGPYLVALVGVGFACFGVFCFAWARHLDR